jgi:hypothetical protein
LASSTSASPPTARPARPASSPEPQLEEPSNSTSSSVTPAHSPPASVSSPSGEEGPPVARHSPSATASPVVTVSKAPSITPVPSTTSVRPSASPIASSPSVGATGPPRSSNLMCMAVGTYWHTAEFHFEGRRGTPWQSPYALELDDGTWSLMSIPVDESEPDVGISAVVCASRLFPSQPEFDLSEGHPGCVAVGDSSLLKDLPEGRAWTSNLSSWKELDTAHLRSSANSLNALSCVSRVGCVATGWSVIRTNSSSPVGLRGNAHTTAAAALFAPRLASANAQRQAVVATYLFPSPWSVAPSKAATPWLMIVSSVVGVGLAIAAGFSLRRRRTRMARREGGLSTPVTSCRAAEVGHLTI